LLRCHDVFGAADDLSIIAAARYYGIILRGNPRCCTQCLCIAAVGAVFVFYRYLAGVKQSYDDVFQSGPDKGLSYL